MDDASTLAAYEAELMADETITALATALHRRHTTIDAETDARLRRALRPNE